MIKLHIQYSLNNHLIYQSNYKIIKFTYTYKYYLKNKKFIIKNKSNIISKDYMFQYFILANIPMFCI